MRFRPLAPFHRNDVSREDYDPFALMRGDWDRMFDEFFTGAPAARAFPNGRFAPSMDVEETDKNVVVRAELPGVDEKDVELELHGDLLTLKGEKKEEKTDESNGRHVTERRFGSFVRSLRLPFEPNDDGVKAEFKKGVLTVTVAKPKELATEPRKIMITPY